MPYGIDKAPENRTCNALFCVGCNSLLISLHVHDYKVCDCGNMVDGGMEYIRRGFESAEAYDGWVYEVYDWGVIFALAEIGMAQAADTNSPELMSVVKELVRQERLIACTLDDKEIESKEGGDEYIETLPPVLTDDEKELRDRIFHAAAVAGYEGDDAAEALKACQKAAAENIFGEIDSLSLVEKD